MTRGTMCAKEVLLEAMSVTPLAAVMVVALFVVAFLFLWVFGRRREHRFFANLGIPGPKPDLLAGNMIQMKRDPLGVTQDWILKYGDVFGYFMGDIPCLSVTNVELIKQCLVKEADLFCDRPHFPVDVEPFTSSLFGLAGEEWKQVRSYLNPVFTPTKLKKTTQIISDCADEMLRAPGEAVAEEGVVDMLSVSRDFSMDVITKSALGWQVNCHKNSSHPLLAAVLGVMSAKDSIIEHCFRFPALRKVLKWLYPFATYYRVTTEITSTLHETIKLRRNGATPQAGDILQQMLDAQVCAEGVTRKPRNDVMYIEDRHILASSFSFLVAGFDTTASALAFIIHLLAKHPEEQDRIFSEMQRTFSEEAELTYDGVQQLKRLDMVISETLRLYPPVVFFICRRCRATTTLMGHLIPAGVNVVVPTWHIHHDPKLWHEPFKFLPERFAEGEKHHPAAYLPFGLGPRQCIGKRFALLELKFAVCRIVGKYEIYQCERTQDPLKLVVPSVNINPEKGVYVRFKER